MDDTLDIIRVLVTNGAKADTDIPLATIIIWCEKAGYAEKACLLGLSRAAGAGWIIGIRHFEFIRLTRAGVAAVSRSTH